MAGHKTWAIGEEVIASDFGPYVGDQIVAVFASAAARTSGWGSPPAGAVSTLLDTPSVLWVYDGAAWQRCGPQKFNVGHTLSTANLWQNNSTFAPLPVAVDRSAFTIPITKRNPTSRIIVSIQANVLFVAGVAQRLCFGVGWGAMANTVEVAASHTMVNASFQVHLGGTTTITGLAAGAYSFEPCYKASTGAHQSQLNGGEETLSFTVEEVL